QGSLLSQKKGRSQETSAVLRVYLNKYRLHGPCWLRAALANSSALRLSLGGVAREFLVGQAHVVNHDLIGSDVDRGLKIRHATRTARATGGVNRARGDEVVLIDTISANPQAADEHAIAI